MTGETRLLAAIFEPFEQAILMVADHAGDLEAACAHVLSCKFACTDDVTRDYWQTTAELIWAKIRREDAN